MSYQTIDSQEQLRELYGTPMELVVKKQQQQLDQFSQKFIELSAFSILSTSNAKGEMDCSPRGDYPGFIHQIDEKTIALPDRPGNNRLDSLSNIIENPHIGLLILIPGFKECLRINGSAKIVADSELIKVFEHKGRLPKSAILVTIDDVYFHCAKAISRAKLWDVNSHVDRKVMPSLGKILMNQIDSTRTEAEIKAVEELIEHRAKTTLY